MCPPGYHVVQGHERTCHSGTTTWVDAHVRKNRGKIAPGLLKENIFHLFWNSKKKYSSLNPIAGFHNKGSEFDTAIQFWLEYWKAEGVSFPDDLDPLMIKAMIAVESGFGPAKKSKVKGSTAAGLMQVTDQAMRVLGGFPNKRKWIEAKDNLVHIAKTDKLDPLVNIAVGIRLLGHKFSQTPKKWEKNARSAIRSYYSRGDGGTEYADKVLELYEKSKKK
jgi:hypothetical protein